MNHDFHIGDKVVYPNHGVGIVEQISSRTIGSMVQKYYELHIKASNLRVTIPFSNVESVGLRRVIKSGDIDRILEVLTNSKCENHADWKFRFKENSEKMKGGSLLEIVEVFKALLIIQMGKPLSFREKKMLERARSMIILETSIAKSVSETDAIGLISKALGKSSLPMPAAL